jgi:hypothetical protein
VNGPRELGHGSTQFRWVSSREHDRAIGSDDGGRRAPASQPPRQFATRLGNVHDGSALLELGALEGNGSRRRDECETVPQRGVEPLPAGQDGVGAQRAGQLPETAALDHQGVSAQRRGAAVDDPLAHAGDQVQPRGDDAPDSIAEPSACGHRPPHSQRQTDHGAGVWLSLLLVGVQHLRGELSADYARQLPCQIHRIPKTCSHALADERRCEMGGVAEKENVPIPPPVGDLRPKRVLGYPHQLEVLIVDVVDPWRNQGSKRSKRAVVVGSLVG